MHWQMQMILFPWHSSNFLQSLSLAWPLVHNVQLNPSGSWIDDTRLPQSFKLVSVLNCLTNAQLLEYLLRWHETLTWKALVLSLKSEMPHHPVLATSSTVCVAIYRQTLCCFSHRYLITFIYQIIYQKCKFFFSFNMNSIQIKTCLDLQSQASYCAFSKYNRTAKGIQIHIQIHELAHKSCVEDCLKTLFLSCELRK